VRGHEKSRRVSPAALMFSVRLTEPCGPIRTGQLPSTRQERSWSFRHRQQQG
jgi:hypothetical protein